MNVLSQLFHQLEKAYSKIRVKRGIINIFHCDFSIFFALDTKHIIIGTPCHVPKLKTTLTRVSEKFEARHVMNADVFDYYFIKQLKTDADGYALKKYRYLHTFFIFSA